MVKPPKTTQNTTEDNTLLADQLKLIDSSNFLSDITVGMESFIDKYETKLDNQSILSGSIKLGPDCGPTRDTTVVYKKDGKYYVYFNISELTADWWTINIASFSTWLMSLQQDDCIYFHQTGDVRFFPSMAQILNTIDCYCPAKKIFVVDHIVTTPLFLFVSDEIEIKDVGAVSFSSPIEMSKATISEKAFLIYLRSLYNRGIERNFITVEEANAVINDNLVVFRTSRELRDRMKT